jgi:hypothetical protein
MIIYVDNDAAPTPVLLLAEARAAGMFSSSGLRIEWHGKTPDGGQVPTGAIAIRLIPQTPVGFLPRALAFTRPFEGVHITVFWDRIQQATRSAPPAVVLAHVLVHEITHILQGVDRHSDSGVMKARWSDKDYAAMAWKTLPFTPEDILLIRLGLQSELHSAASNALADPALSSLSAARPPSCPAMLGQCPEARHPTARSAAPRLPR